MKFSYITDEILDSSSVEATHVDEVCKNLYHMGHAVKLYAPPTKTFYGSAPYDTCYIGGAKFFITLFFQWKLYAQLKRDIKKERPDIIYVRHNLLLATPAYIGKKYGIPVILEVNGRLLDETPYADQSLQGKILLSFGIFRAFERYTVKNASRMVVVAPGIKKYLIENYNVPSEKVIIVLNAVDTDSFKPENRELTRKKLGLPAEGLYVGYIGSFYSWQGLRYIVEAAQLVLKEKPEATFLIIGKGDEFDYLRSFVAKNKIGASVKILPAISHDAVPSYINALDICLCYPKKFRSGATSPFKVYEYLACGRAVILSDIEGMRAEFRDNIVYAEPESADALSKEIIALLNDTGQRETLAAKGRVFVEKEHSWGTVAQQIITICKSVTAS